MKIICSTFRLVSSSVLAHTARLGTFTGIQHKKCVCHYSTDANLRRAKANDHIRKRGTMTVWQIFDYGGLDSLTMSTSVRIPIIKNPNELLVEVHAASVNPIDVLMTEGYGSKVLNVLRNQSLPFSTSSEFPLILGRDFSGVVVEAGKCVKGFKVGDEVWGTLGPQRQGSHAQYVITSPDEISLKPKTKNHIDSASLPYVAATTWTALCSVGELTESNAKNKRVLVHGGSGGIGTFAIQLLKAWGANVTTTCGTDAIEMVKSLGADDVVDYKTQDPSLELALREKFDFIYDPLGKEKTGYSIDFLKTGSKSMFVTIASPLLPSVDEHGMLGGVLKWGMDLGSSVLKGFSEGKNYRVAFFLPNATAMNTVSKLVDSEKIKPVIDEVFVLEDLPKAYEKVGKRSGRGKTVIDLKS